MLQEDKVTYLATPPTYAPIQTMKSTNNIQDYISMTINDGAYGVVLDYEKFIERFHSGTGT